MKQVQHSSYAAIHKNQPIKGLGSNLTKLQNVFVHDFQYPQKHRKCLPLKPTNNHLLKKTFNDFPKSLPGLAIYNVKKQPKQQKKLFHEHKRQRNLYLSHDEDILKTDEPSTEKETKKSSSINKTIKTEPPYLNEFMELKPPSTKNYLQPKIIENQVLRLGNHQNIVRKKLRSEEKSRNIMKDERLSKEKQGVNGFNLTFYQSLKNEGRQREPRMIKGMKIEF